MKPCASWLRAAKPRASSARSAAEAQASSSANERRMNRASALRLGVLISGRGSNMQAVARACRDRLINAEISVVVADRDGAGGLAIARELGLRTEVVPWTSDRAAFERAVTDVLKTRGVEVVVLAGFMRVLSPEFAAAFAGK